MVLYEFGGVYADLDTECLRPLNRILFKYACVISPEPYEHSSLVYNAEFLVTNSIMFCAPKHPFLKQVMDSLPDFSHFSQDIDATGPNFLTYQYKLYRDQLLDSHFQSMRAWSSKRRTARPQVKGTKAPDKDDDFLLVDDMRDDFIYVPSSQYFQNNLDPVRFEQFREMCQNFDALNSIAKRGCVSLKYHGMKSRKSLFEYTRHSFYHTGYKWLSDGDMAVSDLVPGAVLYSE